MIAAAPPRRTPWFHSLDWERLLETYGVPLLAAIVVLLVGLWVARRLSNAMPRATARMGWTRCWAASCATWSMPPHS